MLLAVFSICALLSLVGCDAGGNNETSYKITVKTSDIRGAGTDANVYIILFGANGDSGQLHLKKSETFQDPFEQNQKDVFTIDNMLSLGELSKLRVWHDNAGLLPEWHLAFIEVEDMKTHKVYRFHCDKWLSKTDDDKQIVRELTCHESDRPGSAGDGTSDKTALCDQRLTARVDNLIIENTALECKVTHLQTRLHNATQEIAVLEALVNSCTDKPQVPGSTCYKGMQSNTSRQEFLLWGHVPALCDTETDGGGWVIIQRRARGDVNFTRNWTDYKNGFGTPKTDFWIGLDVIHNLTSQGYSKLRFEYVTGGRQYYGDYSNFSVASESMKYRISGSGFHGNAVDCLTGNDSAQAHNNMYFSTIDRDNDNYDGNCAVAWKTGWWYNECYLCNFNGIWGVNDKNGMAVHSRDIDFQYLSFTEMKLRRG